MFKEIKKNVLGFIKDEFIPAYLAGRFDGDGSVASDYYSYCTIVYGSRDEAERDREFINRLGLSKTKVYHYKSARTFCVYVSRLETEKFLNFLYPYSVRLQKSVFAPRRDLIIAKQ